MSLPAPREMEAWVLRPERHGEPAGSMRKERVPVPEPGDDEVLVRVMAAGLNYSGVWAALGKPVSPFAWHGSDYHIPGTDGAGVVWSVGKNVTVAKPGDAIVIQPNVRCGTCAACARDPVLCDRYRIFGYETPRGTFAPFTLVKDHQVFPKPPHLTWEAAGSYMVSLLTAYHMLVDRAALERTDDTLMWGAAGGMGVYGVQIGRLFGNRVIAMVSTKERAALAKKLGAHAALNRNAYPAIYNVHKQVGKDRKPGLDAIKEFRDEVRSLLGGKDADVVFEHVGEATFFASVYVAGPGGRIVLCGATTGYDLTFDARYLWLQRKSIVGAHSAPIDQCRKAHDLVADRKIEVVLTETFSFDDVARANQLMFENKISGNVACLIDAPSAGLREMPAGFAA